ncbi:hypothetical protein [Chamaesiphon sp. VAR_48_metabat_403]|nr:hypothetical protein [Chamaesiphon sp. VAR_48_metabat_403]
MVNVLLSKGILWAVASIDYAPDRHETICHFVLLNEPMWKQDR